MWYRFSQQNVDGQKETVIQLTVPERHYGAIQDKIEDIARIAKRLNLNPPSMKDLKIHDKILKDGTVDRYIDVEIKGSVPVLPGGWELIAVVDHTYIDEGENIIAIAPGKTLTDKSFYSSQPVCDFCNQNRKRNKTFVIQSEDGEVRSVGTTCVKHHLGWHSNPMLMSEYLDNLDFTEILEEKEPEEMDYDEDDVRHRGYYGTLEYIANVAAVYRKYGFVSKAKSGELEAMPTASLASHNMFGNYQICDVEVTPEDYAKAQEIIKWWQGLDRNWAGNNGYLNNVVSLQNVVSLRDNHIGLAASVVPLYEREMQKQRDAEMEDKTDIFIGETGKRMPLSLQVQTIKGRMAPQYGMRRQEMAATVTMVDSQGRRVVWFASSISKAMELTEGKIYNMQATVRDHNEKYRNTIITRPTIKEEFDSFEEAESKLTGKVTGKARKRIRKYGEEWEKVWVVYMTFKDMLKKYSNIFRTKPMKSEAKPVRLYEEGNDINAIYSLLTKEYVIDIILSSIMKNKDRDTFQSNLKRAMDVITSFINDLCEKASKDYNVVFDTSVLEGEYPSEIIEYIKGKQIEDTTPETTPDVTPEVSPTPAVDEIDADGPIEDNSPSEDVYGGAKGWYH